MQQFTVPQFIDVEDKIIGPITVRQFIIILAGFMFIALCYKVLNFSVFLIASILIFIVIILFAFYKVNGMPFHFFILNFVETLKKPNLSVWGTGVGNIYTQYEDDKQKVMDEKPSFIHKTYSSSRLAELSLIVDTRGSYRGEEK